MHEDSPPSTARAGASSGREATLEKLRRLAEVDKEIAKVREEKSAVREARRKHHMLREKETARRQAQEEHKRSLAEEHERLEQLKEAESRVQAQARAASENERFPGCRPGFHKAYHGERAALPGRAVYEAQPRWGIGAGGSADELAIRNREKGERWDADPVMGGGHTIKVYRAQSARQNQEERIAALEQQAGRCGLVVEEYCRQLQVGPVSADHRWKD
eukprot:CAMPEP_0118946280 /NCGR_PEP_ID=MMETSP1169-20130426/43960_1 /TAXON_ID=36882 /ORGANISM="Pyramimonas obovata, Strain CCMP722" /LENGTH=217 /DNA_ID=CAMNT_0006892211 /DNA_START=124 /DNA_END=774 /DNA_ORIENTATION=-